MKSKKVNTVSQDPNDILKSIGAKLARCRKKLGYTNSDDFAYDREINRSQYGKYEAGSQDVRITTLLKIVNSMGMTLEEFFGEGLGPK